MHRNKDDSRFERALAGAPRRCGRISGSGTTGSVFREIEPSVNFAVAVLGAISKNSGGGGGCRIIPAREINATSAGAGFGVYREVAYLLSK